MRKVLLRGIALGALALTTGLGGANAALAQDTAAAPAEEGIQEVVVTAEKRMTSAQSTAISLSVLSADYLKENGVGDIAQLSTVAPSINLGQNAGATTVAVRGVSSRDITEIGDPAVAINVDGVFLQRPTGMNASFFDLERIEVLRGPQGTLYGRNATGGVVNILTKKPGHFYSGYGALTYGNFDTINMEAAANIPLTDKLAMRAAFVSRSHEGYRDNGAAGKGDDEDSKGGRLSFLYEPTSNLKILLSASYLKQGGIGPVYYGIPTASTQPIPPTDAGAVEGFKLSTRGNFDVARSTVSAQVDYDLQFATLTYLVAYVRLDFKHLWDNDGQPDKYFDYHRDEDSGDMSHEIRLASNNKSGFVWQTGLYFYNQDMNLNNNFLLSPGKVPVSVREYHFDVDSKSWAAFGQASYDITQDLKVSAGVRYSKDEKARKGHSYVGALAQDVSSGTAVRTYSTESTSASSDKITWHLGLDYKVAPKSLLYAKIDTGYKSGGFTLVAPYEAEELTAFEVGSKNRFFGNTLQVNASAYFYDYKNQQVSQFISSGPLTGQSTVVNAGASEIKGAEVEVVWKPAPESNVDFSIAYNDGKFTDFKVANGASNLDLSGNHVIQSPEWSLSAGYDHSFKLAGGELKPRIQTQYRSSSYLTFYNRPNDRQEGYSLTDIMVNYTPSDSQWTLQAFVRNLEDTVVLTNADQGGPYAATRYQFGAPRTMGVRLQYDW